MLFLEATTVLIVLAAAFGLANHHLVKLPFTIGLLIAGLVSSLLMLGFDQLFPQLGLADDARAALAEIDFAETVLHGMLSILLFAGALHTDLDRLLARARSILTLATVGVMISTAVAAGAAWVVFRGLGIELSFAWCLVFGALISPTDPIAVLGIMRSAGAPKALESKVVGESLFNDGVGVVVFLVLVQLASGGGDHGAEVSALGVAKLLVVEIVGGVVLGLAVGWLTYRALRSLDSPNLEILISAACILAINSVALRLHVSAPLAAVMAGLLLGNQGRRFAMSATTKKNLDIVWHFIDEALNAVLFLLVGLEVFALDLAPQWWIAGLILIPLVLLARTASVMIPLTTLVRVDDVAGARPVLIWGGLKGGISVALAMGLAPFEGRDAILVATYVTVIFSIIVQGLTVGALIRRVAVR
jgi:CPA1 family monovalent cation:H+ antiporter